MVRVTSPPTGPYDPLGAAVDPLPAAAPLFAGLLRPQSVSDDVDRGLVAYVDDRRFVVALATLPGVWWTHGL